jgi:hypothetical protein
LTMPCRKLAPGFGVSMVQASTRNFAIVRAPFDSTPAVLSTVGTL